MHMAVARLGCKRTMVGTGWANFRPGCMSRLRKHYPHLSGGSFLAKNASWALSGCLPIESADHYMLVNEWAWLNSRVGLLRLEVEISVALVNHLMSTYTCVARNGPSTARPDHTKIKLTL